VIFIDGQYSTIIFEGNSTVNFTNNGAGSNGGVMYMDDYSAITFEGNSIVNFTDNISGVMYINDYTNITFEENSTVNFIHNGADNNGGVMYIRRFLLYYHIQGKLCFKFYS